MASWYKESGEKTTERGLDLKAVVPVKNDNGAFMAPMPKDGKKAKSLIAKTSKQFPEYYCDEVKKGLLAIYEKFGLSALESCASAALASRGTPDGALFILRTLQVIDDGQTPDMVVQKANVLAKSGFSDSYRFMFGESKGYFSEIVQKIDVRGLEIILDSFASLANSDYSLDEAKDAASGIVLLMGEAGAKSASGIIESVIGKYGPRLGFGMIRALSHVPAKRADHAALAGSLLSEECSKAIMRLKDYFGASIIEEFIFLHAYVGKESAIKAANLLFDGKWVKEESPEGIPRETGGGDYSPFEWHEAQAMIEHLSNASRIGGEKAFDSCFETLGAIGEKANAIEFMSTINRLVIERDAWGEEAEKYSEAVGFLADKTRYLDEYLAALGKILKNGKPDSELTDAGIEALLETCRTVEYFSGKMRGVYGFMTGIDKAEKKAECARIMRDGEFLALLEKFEDPMAYIGGLTIIADRKGKEAAQEWCRTIMYYDKSKMGDVIEKAIESQNIPSNLAAMRTEGAKKALWPVFVSSFRADDFSKQYEKAGLIHDSDLMILEFMKISQCGEDEVSECAKTLKMLEGNMLAWRNAIQGFSMLAGSGGDVASAARELGKSAKAQAALFKLDMVDPYFVAMFAKAGEEGLADYYATMGQFKSRKDIQSRLSFNLYEIAHNGADALSECCKTIAIYAPKPEVALEIAVAMAEKTQGGGILSREKASSIAIEAASECINERERKALMEAEDKMRIGGNLKRFRIFEDVPGAIAFIENRGAATQSTNFNDEQLLDKALGMVSEEFLGKPLHDAFSETKKIILATPWRELFDRERGGGSIGVYNPGTNVIRIATGGIGWFPLYSDDERLSGLVHEMLHFASDVNRDKLRDIYSSGQNYGYIKSIDEGLTDYFAKQLVRSNGTEIDFTVGYEQEVKMVYFLKQIVGERVLKDAYFTNDFTEVEKRLDARLGSGTFKEFMNAGGTAEMIAMLLRKAEERKVPLREFDVDTFWR